MGLRKSLIRIELADDMIELNFSIRRRSKREVKILMYL